MASFHRSRRHRRRKSFLRTFAVVLALAGVLGLGLLIRGTGGDTRQFADPQDPAMVQLLEESRSEAARYRALAAEGRHDSPEAIQALDAAIEKRRAFLYRTGTNDWVEQRELDELERERNARRIADLLAQSEENEARAREAREAGDPEGALEALREAHRQIVELNRLAPTGSQRQTARETRLAMDIAAAEAEPLHHRSMRLEEQARAALAAGDFTAAESAFLQAHDLQIQINRNFSRSRFADSQRAAALDAEVASLRAASTVVRRDEAVATAEQAWDREDWQQAADAFRVARDYQRQINQEFPRSRFVSIEQAESFETRRQTALGKVPAQRILNRLADLDRALANGDAAGGRRLADTLAIDLRAFEDEFPRSEAIDADVRQRILYLSQLGDRLGTIVELTRDQTLPVPGIHGVRLARTEVSQALFEAVMGANPSRQAGPSRPVDSVNWNEAAEFCRRLGWALGRSVRLPTREEFLAAAGQPSVQELVDQAASRDTTAEGSRPVGSLRPNEAGFHDLLGNVAEWLQPTNSDSPVGYLAGGSAADALEDLAAVPVNEVAKNNRSRTIGFRFAIE